MKHLSIGTNQSILIIKTFKFQCRACQKYFNQRIPGVKLNHAFSALKCSAKKPH
ncbi:hypothetical protein [Bdellovibrio sp. BCCA]|uniref:hypothetical protein n=1 Tax=Bdellovibrio sp. BCCA TaxID=3136281 RepID=UPI00403FED08